jgi:hypothetical protein
VLALKGRFEARGLRVMSAHEVDEDEVAAERPVVEKAAEEEKMTYPCLLDAGGKWQKSAGIEGLPSFLVVNRDGKIVHKFKGKLTEGSDEFNKLAGAIEQAIGKT